MDLEVEQFTKTTHQLFIGGRWVDAASGETFDTPKPGDRRQAGLRGCGRRRGHRPGRAGRQSRFEDGPWSRMTPSERGRLVWKIGDLILEHLEELAQLESLDNGKPLTIARAADVPLAADLFHYMAGWATKIEGNTIDISVPYAPGAQFHAYTLREPVGVVGQIIPWNFPLLMAAWKLGPALATGNCVVLKPAEQTPLSALAAGSADPGGRHPRWRGQRRHRLRRDGGRPAGRSRRRGQGGLHRFDRGRQDDRAGRRRATSRR